MTGSSKAAALRFVLAVGVVNLFADFAYEGGRSLRGRDAARTDPVFRRFLSLKNMNFVGAIRQLVFRLGWIAAAMTAFSLCSASAAAANAPSCPVAARALVPLGDHRTYGVIVGFSKQHFADLKLALYSNKATYEVSLLYVPATRKAPRPYGSDVRFASEADPIFVTLPEPDDIAAARILQPGLCQPQTAYSPQLPHARNVTTPNERAEMEKSVSDGAPTQSASLVGPLDAKCGTPFSPAFVTRAVAPDYPASAVANRQTGTVSILVDLTATGDVAGASVLKSSDFYALDAAAVDSAKRSRYSPEVFQCRATAGDYIFRADFTSQ